MDRWLVVGSALYWAAVGLRYLGPTSPTSDIAGPWNAVVKYVFLLMVLVGSYGIMKAMGVRRGRVVLAVAVLVAVGVEAIGTVGAVWQGAYGVYLALEFFVIGAFMLLWGVAFASFDKHRAAQNVIVTILVAVLLIVGAVALEPLVGLTAPSYLFYGTSAAIILTGRVPCANHERTPVEGQRRHETVTVLQRLAFGVGLTVCSGFARCAIPAVPHIVLLAMAVAVLGVALAVASRSPQGMYTALPALLFVAVGALYLPFFEEGLASAAWGSAGIIWIAWSAFSAVQLSDLKERYGMSELSISFLDKITLALGFVLGGFLWVPLGARPDAAWLEAGELCMVGVAMTLVLGSAYAMARLVGARQEDAVRDELTRTREERLHDVYEQIAGEYGFSRREREVMEMLAKGYTSVYICEELGISAGTAKAHTAHIYQKLGIHRKDELLELIDDCMARA